MSEISQTTPVKPAWPVRRDESRQKRTGSESQDKQKKKKLPPEPTGDGGKKYPQIDDYA